MSEDIQRLEARVAELEAKLDRAVKERDLFRETAYSVFRLRDPYTTPTAEELHDMLHAPRGEPLAEIIAAAERELGAA